MSQRIKADYREVRRNQRNCRASAKLMAARDSMCDPDNDRLPSRNEVRRYRTNYKKRDSDGDALFDNLELSRYGTNPRKANTDGDGCSDGVEVLISGTNPLVADCDRGVAATPTPAACAPPNFDANGNTGSFGIPSGMTGNKAAGDTVYQQRCVTCHAAATLSARKGYHRSYSGIQTALALPYMNISLPAQQLSDLVASLNQDDLGGTGNCTSPTPTPIPGGITPTPTLTPTPYTPPTPCAGGNFDGQGNTAAFGIPSPLLGNIGSGQTLYNQTCGTGGCHGNTVRNPGMQFGPLKSAVTSPPMSLTGISDQTFAHIVAYLNQSDVGGCNMGTPTPTPTPNPITYGQQIFTSSCGLSGCHSLNSLGRPREMDRHPSRSKIHDALWNGPDDMPQFRHFTAGQTAPPYTVQEEALYQYLNSLP